MTTPVNILGQESFEHGGRTFEVVFFKDATGPFMTYFEVLSGGRRVPLEVPGEGLCFVRFQSSDEGEQDAAFLQLESPLELLKQEARRLVEETY